MTELYLSLLLLVFFLAGVVTILGLPRRWRISALRIFASRTPAGLLALRQNPLDLRSILSMALVYLMSGVALLSIYVVVLIFVNLSLKGDVLAVSWLSSLTAVIAAFAFLKPVLGQVRKFAGMWSHRRRDNYLRAQKIFSRYCQDISDQRLLALTTEQAITLATDAADVRLLVPADNGMQFISASERISPNSSTYHLRASSSIVTWLRFHDDALSREDLLTGRRALPISPQEWIALQDSKVQLLIPMKHREELAGILAVASKRSGEPYSEVDMILLHAAASEMAAWVSNAGRFASVDAERARLEQLLERAVHDREEERKRIAMELHDSPVQWVTSAIYHVEACLGLLPKGEKKGARKQLEIVHRALDKSLQELRQTASALHPPELEKVGLEKCLARHADIFELETGILTNFQAFGPVPRLDAPVELAAYRVVQEALSNVRKHSNATEVSLQLGMHNGALWAILKDNGEGFEVDDGSSTDSTQLGLAGMEERAHMLGGTLGIQSTPGEGTRITLLIPHIDNPTAFSNGAEAVLGSQPEYIQESE